MCRPIPLTEVFLLVALVTDRVYAPPVWLRSIVIEIAVSVHPVFTSTELLAPAALVSVTTGLAVPNPLPRRRIVRCVALAAVAPISLAVRNGLDTENRSGVCWAGVLAPALTSHSTGLMAAVPGAPAITPTWVGAVSVTVQSPGQAWNSVPMVRKRGL